MALSESPCSICSAKKSMHRWIDSSGLVVGEAGLCADVVRPAAHGANEFCAARLNTPKKLHSVSLSKFQSWLILFCKDAYKQIKDTRIGALRNSISRVAPIRVRVLLTSRFKY